MAGLLGIGGGVVLIPLLIYVGHTPIKVAASVGMVVVIVASFFGGLAHYGRGNIHLPTGVWMGLGSISGAMAGSLFSGVFPSSFFYSFYIGLVAAGAVMLLLPRRGDRVASRQQLGRRIPIIGMGVFKGFVTGVLGIGGSFIIIPLMFRFLDLPIHTVVGTSLMITLFSALAGFLGKLAVGHYDFHIILWVVFGTIPATQLGVWAAQKSSPGLLRLILVILLILILLWMCRPVFS